MTADKKTDETPSIYDKDWQVKDELGTVNKTFSYVGLDGAKAKVTAKATIYPGHQFEVLAAEHTKKSKTGIDTMDTTAYSRAVVKMVYGIDGTGLQNILKHKGGDLHNQMRNFAYELSGLSLTEDEIEDQKN